MSNQQVTNGKEVIDQRLHDMAAKLQLENLKFLVIDAVPAYLEQTGLSLKKSGYSRKRK